MAIDTKAKRMNMLSVANPIGWHALFEVDGAVDADDRAVLLHIYGGNALGAPVAVTDTSLSIAATPAKTIVRKIASKVTDIRGDLP